ncbi:MAG: D-alanine--D-alanine ligase [Nitriliruptoraceae bacterium]|nr:D-alanine--D-alanine ligase [Nitriliruptoraceae bacterium]
MIRVLLLYGGRSAEHEISCLSARSVLEVIDRDRYEVVTVGITREGRWVRTDGTIETAPGDRLPHVADLGPSVGLIGTPDGPRLLTVDGEVASVGPVVDVAFPLLHGPFGEDGTVQGMLETVGVPYVGADVTASSIGIDKAAMKASFAAAGLPQGGYLAVHRSRWSQEPEAVTAELAAAFPPPWFTKPARQGSSIGISKVHEVAGLDAAMAEAYEHDEVVVIEQGIEHARELEVGVLGRGQLDVTRPGEIVSSHEFYDFEAKYLDASELLIPADVPAGVAERVDALARRAYRAINCRGLARVDFFATRDGAVVVNEINTIPGFTPSSMFPRLWAAEGLDYPALVDRLLHDALG